jgi:hypothetical protein
MYSTERLNCLLTHRVPICSLDEGGCPTAANVLRSYSDYAAPHRTLLSLYPALLPRLGWPERAASAVWGA